MAKRIPSRGRGDPSRFFSPLCSTFYELVMISLLLIQAFTGYLAQKFARYCKLPTPCVLCSRLDGKTPYLYKDLICSTHMLEVSSLAYCRAHQKLANAHEMCDSCLLSFLGKIWRTLHDGLNARFSGKKLHGENGMRVLLPKRFLKPGSISKRSCSCCSAPFKNIPVAYRLLQIRQSDAVPAAPLSRSHLRAGLPKGRQKSTRSLAGDYPCNKGMPGIGSHNELKFASDSELEVPNASESGDVKEELLSRCLQAGRGARSLKIPAKAMSSDRGKVKRSASVSSKQRRLHVSKGHGSEDASLVSSQAMAEHVPFEASISRLEVPERAGFGSNGDVAKPLTSGDIGSRTSQMLNDKLAAGTWSPFPSPAADFAAGREFPRAPDDLRARLSQVPTARWLDLPWNEMSSTPRASGQFDDSKFSEGFSAHARRSIVDRHDGRMECLDGSSVNKIDGENEVDRLKRQIEMDRKCMSTLHKELEEERNAAEIAASQAMAMINRLQEEKASNQMEALQYLRMMEEQSEYDQEALQKLDDLLADRDKEIQDLEAIVESYRKQFGEEPLIRAVESPYYECSTPRFMRSRGRENGKGLMRNTMLDFEDEKAYISDSLRRLEIKLRLSPTEGDYSYGSGTLVKRSILPDTIAEEDESSSVTDDDPNPRLSNVSKEDSQMKASLTPSALAINMSFKDAFRATRLRAMSFNERNLKMGSRRNDVSALGNEISQLTSRLEALEEDRNFIEHAVSSLGNGSSGIEFVQEIAFHLRELRKMGTAR